MIDDLLGDRIIESWTRLELVVEWVRERYQQPRWSEHWELLFNEITALRT
jgi:hypothetical protein